MTPKGGGAKYSLQLVKVNTDWAKLWLHERIRWPHEKTDGTANPGAFYISQDTHDAYCMLGGAHRKAERARGVGPALTREPLLGCGSACLYRRHDAGGAADS